MGGGADIDIFVSMLPSHNVLSNLLLLLLLLLTWYQVLGLGARTLGCSCCRACAAACMARRGRTSSTLRTVLPA